MSLLLLILTLDGAHAQDEQRDARREVARTEREERRLGAHIHGGPERRGAAHTD